MRAVLQRVTEASVTVDDAVVGRIDRGLLVLLGIGVEDDDRDARWMADKIAGLRIFEDDAQKMNRSVRDIAGSVLLVSQFTLFGDCRKGRRPGFSAAAPPEQARRLVDVVAAALAEHALAVEHGSFGAHMAVRLLNDGPVTILLDSTKLF